MAITGMKDRNPPTTNSLKSAHALQSHKFVILIPVGADLTETYVTNKAPFSQESTKSTIFAMQR